MQTVHFSFPISARTVVGLLLVASLSACGNKDAPKPATQVAARVGTEEISVHQINHVLSRSQTGGASPAEISSMGRIALEKLIDRQLAVGQAEAAKLNRSPEVVAQIESARHEILAAAYLTQFTSSLARPTPEDARAYYDSHAPLFSQRRIFQTQELVVANAPDLATQLRSFASTAKPMIEVSEWLKARTIAFTGGNATRAAEQISLESLDTVHALKDGQSAVIETPETLTLLRLVASQTVPVSPEMALPRITQFLTNQRANAAVTAHLQQLRAATTVSYLGEFAQPQESRTAVDKGLAGLK